MNDYTPGAILDERYEIVRVLGRGGMGCVYEARQLNLDRVVAIKVPADKVLDNATYLARFVREALMCARVAHPHIVAIHDVHAGEVPYIVMEYVDGLPLGQLLHEEASTIFVSDLIEILGQICQGLEVAHAAGVIHRDIKPANIVITPDSQVKIMDFGIARDLDTTSLTGAGSMMGTPYYMAPEQVQGLEVTPATDIYALACVVYNFFTGSYVFTGEIATLLYKHVSQAPVPPSRRNPMLPADFDTALLRGLAKEPGDRFSSASEMHREIRKALRPVAQLPYSQIFPRAPARTHPQDARPALTGASFSDEEVDAYAATSPITEKPSAEVSPVKETSGDAQDLAPIRAEATTPVPQPVVEDKPPDSPSSTKKAPLLVGVAIVVIALATGFFGWKALRNAPPASIEAPVASPATPTTDLALEWLGPEPKSQYVVGGEPLLVRWRPTHSAHNLLYRYRLTRESPERGDTVLRQALTLRPELAHVFADPGDYTLTVNCGFRDSDAKPITTLTARCTVAASPSQVATSQ